jgi:dipeptidyl-peptidase 4
MQFRTALVASVAVATIVRAPVAQQPPRLTIERIASLPALTGTPPSDPIWSPDSTRVAFLWNDKGWPFRDVWIAGAADAAPTQITDLSKELSAEPDGGDSGRSLAQRVTARARGGATDVVWTPDGRKVVFVYGGDLFQVDATGGATTRLTRGGRGASSPAYSPDGKTLSFLRDGDLWLRFDGGDLVRATTIGVPAIGVVPGGRFSRLDREVSSYVWSPDSRHIALLHFDRRRVRRVPIPDYLGDEETRVHELRRGYPGDNDEPRTVALYRVDEGQMRLLDLPDQTLRSITTFSFSPDSRRLLVDENSEDGNDRWIYVAEVDDRSIRELWHDRGESRVTQFFTSGWQSDGKGVVFIGDLDERYRLYSLPLTGGTPKPLTAGDWDVVGDRGTAKVGFVPARKEVFFVANQKNPYERHVYRMPDTGGAITQVTSLAGIHDPFVSPDGSKVALLHSSDTSPVDLYVADAAARTPERRITKSPLPEFYQYKWAQPRYVTFKSRIDGFTLHGRVIEPPNLDRTKKYPVILGSVYSNTVRNEWRGVNSTFQQFLAAEAGYINLQVDIRGSTGYGRQFREKFVRDWGGGDIEDLQSGVEYLATLPYVDPARVGIWGWSYGGTLVTFSLFKKPGLYKAGVGGAPAIDVGHFPTLDVHISKRPNVHPEVFRDDSSINFAGGLKDHLMIVHGLQDDIVPFKTSVMLVEKLEMLGKDFDLVLLPSGTHGALQKDYYAVFVFRKVLDYFDRYLGRGPQPATRSTEAAK